jgi:hypothetical protein
MFVSGWEEDEEGIQPGDKSDPAEQFLLAAENGDIETLKQMFELNPRLLEVSVYGFRMGILTKFMPFSGPRSRLLHSTSPIRI